MPSNTVQKPAVENDPDSNPTTVQKVQTWIKSVRVPTSMDKAKKQGEVPE